MTRKTSRFFGRRTALALVCATLGVRPAIAQSVTGIGDVAPGPVTTPDWVVGGEIVVGDTGVGSLSIENGGTVSSVSGVLGYPGGTGSVTVTGSDGSGNASSWSMTSDLTLGWVGTADLAVLNGGQVSNQNGHVGRDGGSATATVSGVDSQGNASTWTNNSTLAVGFGGTGTLLIQNGGVARSESGTIGGGTGLASGTSTGTVTVTGSDGNGRVSTWDLTTNLYVGFTDPGTLTVNDGAAVNAQTAYVGYQSGGQGTVNVEGRDPVSGRASSWTLGSGLFVGWDDTGELNIQNAGVVRARYTQIAVNPGSTGTLRLLGTAGARGVLETDVVSRQAGSATLELNGGILRATSNAPDFLSGFGTLAGGPEGVWLDTNGHEVGVATAFTGAADFNKLGLGTLTLSGANSYGGATQVAAGRLRAGAANTFSATSAHTVAAGAVLDLAGHAQTIASMDNSGSVSLPGAAGAARTTLTVTGPWVGQAGSTLQLGLATAGGTTVADRLVLDGAAAVASGRTALQVGNTALLLGTQTTGDGIEVVTALNGATTTAQTTRDAFSLVGEHIDAGAYEYRLYARDANGNGENWYLRSDAPTAEPAEPAAPGTAPVPAYRAEVALFAALPEQLRLGNLAMLGNLHQRVGDGARAGEERLAWARAIGVDRRVSQVGAVSPHSEGRLNGLQAGLDLWAAPAWQLGAYLGQLEGDMKVRGFASGLADQAVGRNELRSQYLGFYATHRRADGFYADGVLQLGRHRQGVAPSAAAASRGRGDSLLASLEVGKGFGLAPGWVLEPQLQLMHQRVDLDGVRISGADVEQDSHNSWTLRAGLRLHGEATTPAGALRPYARLNLYRSSKGTDLVRFTGPAGFTDVATRTGGLSTELAAGATLALSARTSLYTEIGRLWASGGESRQRSGLGGSIGVRLLW